MWLPDREGAERVEAAKLIVAYAGGPAREDQAWVRVVKQKLERNNGLMDTEYILNMYYLESTVNWILLLREHKNNAMATIYQVLQDALFPVIQEAGIIIPDLLYRNTEMFSNSPEVTQLLIGRDETGLGS